MDTCNARRRLTLLAGLASIGSYSSRALADADKYPTRPIRVVVPYAAGGSLDTAARLMGAAVARPFGQQIIIDNRPGAGGAIGGAELARSAPDGYTLMVDSLGTMVINSLINKNLTFDPWHAFAPVAVFAEQPLFVAVRSTLPVDDLKGLIAMAKAKPGTVTFGSSGQGSESQLVMELLKQEAGVDMMHVPYKGGAPAVQDLQAGRIDSIAITWTALRAGLERKQVKIIAALSPKRVPFLPAVPSVAEVGYSAMVHVPKTVLFAPAQTPQSILKKWYDGLSFVRDDQGLKEWAESSGSEIEIGDSRVLAAQMEAERKKWAPVTARIKVND